MWPLYIRVRTFLFQKVLWSQQQALTKHFRLIKSRRIQARNQDIGRLQMFQFICFQSCPQLNVSLKQALYSTASYFQGVFTNVIWYPGSVSWSNSTEYVLLSQDLKILGKKVPRNSCCCVTISGTLVLDLGPATHTGPGFISARVRLRFTHALQHGSGYQTLQDPDHKGICESALK